MTDDEGDLPPYYVPDDELRPLLEAIGRAIVDRLRSHGLTAVVVSYDDEEGQTHVTSYFKHYPQELEELDAVWGRLVEVNRLFFDDAVILQHVDEYDGCTEDSYSDHVLTMKAA
jgi:hypothetical protein